MKGKIVEWYDEKGYGFIAVANQERRIFLHVSELKHKHLRPAPNDRVSFDICEDERKRLRAVNASMISMKSFPLTVLFGGSFLVFACVSPLVLHRHLFFIPLYLVLSLFTWLMYAWDKEAAEKGQWRTAENSLHFLSLAGGWPGALLAQQQLRHKSRKQPFKTILWLTILVNIIVFFWSFTASGSEIIQQVTSLLLNP
ncbi:'Cold-shock' DNA-binding domain protein [Vibrio aerogenes CECT 7868]|uniref:'Cold-shock' DNA-binding domain protein n=1 Tax=Vibrio aerogenes CECT 7868 TaxID=1216006 RepID=A0A1M5V3C0_9VIBR|nr:cold shock and DUF1294 domain-containing protein [Vibrio aerogenes]SHH69731.1 'Cold-shock' DNA-binding domain protein [Vibrio aerogenes CECT 7868]